MIKPSFDPYSYIGIGFQLFELDGYKAVGHFGEDRGFRSFLLMIPGESIELLVILIMMIIIGRRFCIRLLGCFSQSIVN
jgi:hypothetical protein